MNTQYVSMEFDAKQMIRLLGNDLYDSPLAMLRENVQNAYDAILERQEVDSSFSPKIDIIITDNQVIVQDNGVGMNGEILAQNYWKAGNSSKNNPRSIAAGVVGHFGIGALANFGVCTKLELKTRRFNEDCSYSTSAVRDNLNIKDSIPITVLDKEAASIGTRVEATLECPGSITPASAKSYLHQYIDYLPIPVYINGEELKEDYLAENVTTDSTEGAFIDIIVPEGTVFVMGDNRDHSSDSRRFGCIPYEKIESKVWLRFWPLNQFGIIKN